jgi:hypothetical protein
MNDEGDEDSKDHVMLESLRTEFIKHERKKMKLVS